MSPLTADAADRARGSRTRLEPKEHARFGVPVVSLGHRRVDLADPTRVQQESAGKSTGGGDRGGLIPID